MTEHISAPVHVILMVLAVVLLGIAAFGWPAPIEAWRLKFLSAGMFCWALASFL